MNLIEFKSVTIGKSIVVMGEKNTNETYDSRIKKGDHFYKSDLNDIVLAEYSPASNVSFPVIASTSPLPNLPRLIIKDEAQRLAVEYYPMSGNVNDEIKNAIIGVERAAFKHGRRTADKEFTREDMIAAYELGCDNRMKIERNEEYHPTLNELIDSIKSTTLLIPCDSSGNPIVTGNTITGYKK